MLIAGWIRGARLDLLPGFFAKVKSAGGNGLRRVFAFIVYLLFFQEFVSLANDKRCVRKKCYHIHIIRKEVFGQNYADSSVNVR